MKLRLSGLKRSNTTHRLRLVIPSWWILPRYFQCNFYYNFTHKHFLKCSLKKVFFDTYSKSDGEQLWRTVISVYIIVNLHECASVELLHALWTCFVEEILLGGLLLSIAKLVFGHVYLKVLSCKSNDYNRKIAST